MESVLDCFSMEWQSQSSIILDQTGKKIQIQMLALFTLFTLLMLLCLIQCWFARY